MSSNQQAASPAPTTWTEPPWSGWIETTGDALLILEAARRGLIPRVTRRLVDSERKMITSGSVFVFDEDESGIKRWTDGFFWSPSRILGNFLLYRETDKRGAGHRGARSDAPSTDANESQYNIDGSKAEGQTLSRPKGEGTQMGVDRHRERILFGSLTNSYKFKPDGLMKKTFSLTISGVSQHLISYYKVEDVENGRLRSPSSLPELASLDISPEYLDKTHFRNPPKVEIGIDGLPRYRGEADDINDSPTLLPAALSSSQPLLSDTHIAESSSAKRTKRYDPYGNPPAPAKRSRKQPKSTEPQSSSSETLSQPPSSPIQQPPPPPGYPDPSAVIVPHPYPPYGMAHSYYQVPSYPMGPPPPQMYPPSPYTQNSSPSPHPNMPAQQAYPSHPPPPNYAATPNPPNAIRHSGEQQHIQQTNTVYYPYPVHHGHYPVWHYSGFAPQPVPQHPPPAAVAASVEGPAPGGDVGLDGPHTDGVENEGN